MDPLQTPDEVLLELGRRCRVLRLARNWRRTTLAERAGISASTLARFESSGIITLQKFLRVAWALGRLDDLDDVFAPPPASTLDELERHETATTKQRGRT